MALMQPCAGGRCGVPSTIPLWLAANSSGASASNCLLSNALSASTARAITSWVGVGSLADVMIIRSEEHTSELQSRGHLVCRLLLEKKNQNQHLIGVLELCSM